MKEKFEIHWRQLVMCSLVYYLNQRLAGVASWNPVIAFNYEITHTVPNRKYITINIINPVIQLSQPSINIALDTGGGIAYARINTLNSEIELDFKGHFSIHSIPTINHITYGHRLVDDLGEIFRALRTDVEGRVTENGREIMQDINDPIPCDE